MCVHICLCYLLLCLTIFICQRIFANVADWQSILNQLKCYCKYGYKSLSFVNQGTHEKKKKRSCFALSFFSCQSISVQKFNEALASIYNS